MGRWIGTKSEAGWTQEAYLGFSFLLAALRHLREAIRDMPKLS